MQGGGGRNYDFNVLSLRGYCREIQVLIPCRHITSLVNSTVANCSYSAVRLSEFEIHASAFTKFDLGQVTWPIEPQFPHPQSEGNNNNNNDSNNNTFFLPIPNVETKRDNKCKCFRRGPCKYPTWFLVFMILYPTYFLCNRLSY